MDGCARREYVLLIFVNSAFSFQFNFTFKFADICFVNQYIKNGIKAL